MFPSLIVRPEVTTISPFVAYLVLSAGLFISRARKLILMAILAMFLAAPSAKAFAPWPGGCGTACMNQRGWWGQPMFYPGVYMYPALVPPWMYYGSPVSYYSMMPPWYMYYRNPRINSTGIQ